MPEFSVRLPLTVPPEFTVKLVDAVDIELVLTNVPVTATFALTVPAMVAVPVEVIWIGCELVKVLPDETDSVPPYTLTVVLSVVSLVTVAVLPEATDIEPSSLVE